MATVLAGRAGNGGGDPRCHKRGMAFDKYLLLTSPITNANVHSGE